MLFGRDELETARALAITLSVVAGWVIGLRLAPNLPPHGDVLMPAVMLGALCGLLRARDMRRGVRWVPVHWLATMFVGFATFQYMGNRDAYLAAELAIPAAPAVFGFHLLDPCIEDWFDRD